METKCELRVFFFAAVLVTAKEGVAPDGAAAVLGGLSLIWAV